MEAWHYWVIVGILLMLIEIFTPGFILASFGIAAFGGAIIAYLDFSFKYQLLSFAILVLTVFFGIRPVYMKYFMKFDDQRKTNVDALIDRECFVTEEIDNLNGLGQVKIGGELWKAQSLDGSKYKKNEIVIVSKIEGATVYIINSK